MTTCPAQVRADRELFIFPFPQYGPLRARVHLTAQPGAAVGINFVCLPQGSFLYLVVLRIPPLGQI